MKSRQSEFGSAEASRSAKASRYGEALGAARARLRGLGVPFEFFETIGSTNDRAAELGQVGAMVVADAQTAGRGRRGHTWFSPAGSGLYVSVVVAPGAARVDPVRATMLLTIAAGVGLAEGLAAASGIEIALKWPNDLFVGPRKLGGILAESAGAGQRTVVVGYGINVRSTAFPPELADRATSLQSELGHDVDRSRVLVETLAAFAARYEDLLAGRFDAILDGWRRRAPNASGARVSWTTAGGMKTGITAGIDADGALLVRVGGATERIISGELAWHEGDASSD